MKPKVGLKHIVHILWPNSRLLRIRKLILKKKKLRIHCFKSCTRVLAKKYPPFFHKCYLPWFKTNMTLTSNEGVEPIVRLVLQ
jgi:hypothetical protein